MESRWVVVTTGLRGVFFGRLAQNDLDLGSERVVLTDAQMCIYWSKETRGVLGLASIGPQKGSRISAPVPELALLKVTSVTTCTEKAVEIWQSVPWS